MEVHFATDVQAKLEQMARDSGRRSDELVEDAVTCLFNELAFMREMLDRRYQEVATGKVQPIAGEEAYRLLMAKTEERRRRCGMTGYILHSEAWKDLDGIREYIAEDSPDAAGNRRPSEKEQQ